MYALILVLVAIVVIAALMILGPIIVMHPVWVVIIHNNSTQNFNTDDISSRLKLIRNADAYSAFSYAEGTLENVPYT
ncbi:MAG: hypothetical protein OHK003_25460 [Anaerolineales bacterium]